MLLEANESSNPLAAWPQNSKFKKAADRWFLEVVCSAAGGGRCHSVDCPEQGLLTLLTQGALTVLKTTSNTTFDGPGEINQEALPCLADYTHTEALVTLRDSSRPQRWPLKWQLCTHLLSN